MIINYFQKQYFKLKLNHVHSNFFFFEEIILSTTKITLKKKQGLNTKFLFYSLINFCIWVRFIAEQQVYLWIIFEDKSLFAKLFEQQNFGIIIEKYWIPGLLSNSYVVYNGQRYMINSIYGNFKINRKLDFAFFCSTKRGLVLQEINNQLIPQFAMIWQTTSILSNCFIPLFVPKFNQQHFIYQRFLSNFSKFGSITNQVIFKSKRNERYLIYLFFLFLIFQ